MLNTMEHTIDYHMDHEIDWTQELRKSVSPRRRVILDVIESFRAWDLEKIMAWRTEDCVTLIVPSKQA